MKKLFLLAAISTVLLHSCSGEREEEVISPKPENKNLKTEIKLNNYGVDSKIEEALIDSTKMGNPVSSGVTPPAKLEPDDSEVVDPTKPDKPW